LGDEVNRPVASAGHTAGVLAILGAFGGWGAFNAAHMRATGGNHHLALYLQTLAFEWLLLAFILWGVRRSGASPAAVLGDRWSSPLEFWRDLRVAVVFWFASLIALGVLARALGIANQRESVRFLLPNGPAEIAIWVVLSITAGICEEAVFRGYLQRQFLAATHNPPLAIALSAVVFGAGHIYQGYRGAILIACYGAMFGILAHWRNSVRPGMLAHAWQDTMSGLLGSIIRR
jgi:membrane protease YdiL (CAAX protease family)